MNQEHYEHIKMIVTEFDAEDVITTSVIDDSIPRDDNEGTPLI